MNEKTKSTITEIKAKFTKKGVRYSYYSIFQGRSFPLKKDIANELIATGQAKLTDNFWFER